MILAKARLKKLHKELKGMMPFTEFHHLYKLARNVKTGAIVEVGSYRGLSTVALSKGARKGVKVFAVEPHETFRGVLGGNFGPEDRAAFYRTMLKTGCYENVRLVNLSSEIITRDWSDPVELLFIDGDHTYAGVKRDFSCWSGHLTNDATVIFDDTKKPKLGPSRLVGELIDGKKIEIIEKVGKTTTFRVVETPNK